MILVKPQKSDFENLELKKFGDVYENENLQDSIFEKEECNEMEILDVQFEHCKFAQICMQAGKVEKVTFKDVLFENCDFSNTKFVGTAFIRCEFNNCKLSGSDLAENRFYHVSFLETNASYLNLSMASLENVLFKDSILRNSYFQEMKIKNLYFENADLTRTQFFKTSLKNVDLSSSKIEGIAISIEDIKGAVIDQLQAMDLLYLIGVKVK